MSIISAENLSLSLEGKEVLKNVFFTIKAGEYVGLIGPNGAGKTSLIKVLLGIYKPTKGASKSSTQKLDWVCATEFGFIWGEFYLGARSADDVGRLAKNPL